VSTVIFPGNEIEAEVIYNQSEKIYVLTLHNKTLKWHISKTITTASAKNSETPAARSSAECIVEAPPFFDSPSPLANFGTFTFDSCLAQKNALHGKLEPIGSVGQATVKFEMVASDGTPKAKTSNLSSNKDSFSVTWKNPGP
jgi:hypothetical protein